MQIDGYLRFVVALVFVLALIVGLAWLYRRYSQGRVTPQRRRPGGTRGRRLGIVEAVALDSRRRLVLVRRDDREHLIIVGTQGETVVESGIVAEDGLTLERPAVLGEAFHADDHPGDDPHPPTGRRGPRPAKPTSFLRLVRETTRETP